MKTLSSILVHLSILAAFLYVAGVMIHETNNLHDRVQAMAARVDAMTEAMDQAEAISLKEAMRFAPKGKTIYQLRGDAQKMAQSLMDKLTAKHGLPQYELPTIVFRPALRHVNAKGEVDWHAAGQTPTCEVARGVHTIYLNELLYLRNYNEFLYTVIPHEISHILVCMLGGFEVELNEDPDVAAHGEEWESAMRDLGFVKPSQWATHTMDVEPIWIYQHDLAVLLNKALEEMASE